MISQPSYVKTFAATFNELPVERWKPYLRASLVNGSAPYLSKAFADTEFGFYGQTLRGVKENEPRWKRAVNTINGNLGEMLGKLYVERHFTPQAKARMEQLVENLRAAFREGIDRGCLPLEGQAICAMGDHYAGQISDVFAKGQLAVHVRRVHWRPALLLWLGAAVARQAA